MKVAILHDEITDESRPDEIDALHQAEVVERALLSLGHETHTLAVNLDLQTVTDSLHRSGPDLVFNLVESLAGHGRLVHLVPALLETLRVPYTGSSATACLLTTDKLLTKRILQQYGIPTPAWRSESCSSRRPGRPSWEQSPSSVTKEASAHHFLHPPCRCIVKPIAEDASVGINDNAVVNASSDDELLHKMSAAADQYGPVFAEQFIEGREFNVSLLAGPGRIVQPLPAAEIQFLEFPADKPRIVGYAAKWDEDSFECTATPRRFDIPPADATLIERLQSLAAECWRIFDLSGYARVDFRVDHDGSPWVIEVNANPCLAEDAGFMAAAHRQGISTTEVIARIIAAAVADSNPSQKAANTHA